MKRACCGKSSSEKFRKSSCCSSFLYGGMFHVKHFLSRACRGKCKSQFDGEKGIVCIANSVEYGQRFDAESRRIALTTALCFFHLPLPSPKFRLETDCDADCAKRDER